MISRSDLQHTVLSWHALDSEHSVFWTAEKITNASKKEVPFKAQWFVLTETAYDPTEMYEWVIANLAGRGRCFSPELAAPGAVASRTKYWWGFELKEDALMWELRWT